MTTRTMLIEIATMPKVFETEIRVISTKQPLRLPSYEKKYWYVLILPLMWVITAYVVIKKKFYRFLKRPLPKINNFWVDGLGLSARKVKNKPASWQAVSEIYNYEFCRSRKLGILIDDFWENIKNCQALRNRFKLVKQEVRRAILNFSNHKEVRLISLACGSAQAVLETIAELKVKGVVVNVLLIDIDQEALDYAISLANKLEIANQVQVFRGSVSQVIKLSKKFKPQIIEMLGLLDYISQEKAIKLAEKIKQSLEPKGVFITCNIAPNLEMNFVKWVINWSMIYRKPEELVEIVAESGFGDFRIIYEPLKIHGLVIAQK